MHWRNVNGLSTPIGFKNGTDGNLETAVKAILGHQNLIVLELIVMAKWLLPNQRKRFYSLGFRGGSNGPNYFQENINESKKFSNK